MKCDFLLNSAIELGMRIAIILKAYAPKALSAHELIILDHMLINSNDFYHDTESLYPKCNFRTSDIAEKKAVIKQALCLYLKKGIIKAHITQTGMVYELGDAYNNFEACIEDSFVNELSKTAQKIYTSESNKDVSKLYQKWYDNTSSIRKNIEKPMFREIF